MFFNKYVTEMRGVANSIFNKLEDLTVTINELNLKTEGAKHQIPLEDTVNSDTKHQIELEDTVNSGVEIDFNNMDVFSIERKIIDGQPCTIIGHWDLSGGAKTPREWSLFCNKESHEQLIKEFKIHKKNRVS